MFRRPHPPAARQEPHLEAEHLPHDFEPFTDFCRGCGTHRSSLWLSESPLHCPAGPNVIAISHLLALRAAILEAYSTAER